MALREQVRPQGDSLATASRFACCPPADSMRAAPPVRPWGTVRRRDSADPGGRHAQISCCREPDPAGRRTAGRAPQEDQRGPCSFFVIVPDTKAAQYDAVAAGGVLPQPGMWWWATHYARPATDEEATAQARQRLSLMLAGLARLGVPVAGDLGSPSPLEAMEKMLADHQFDEIIVATLPRRVSRWLRAGLPHQAERRFGLPVTTIITSS